MLLKETTILSISSVHLLKNICRNETCREFFPPVWSKYWYFHRLFPQRFSGVRSLCTIQQFSSPFPKKEQRRKQSTDKNYRCLTFVHGFQMGHLVNLEGSQADCSACGLEQQPPALNVLYSLVSLCWAKRQVLCSCPLDALRLGVALLCSAQSVCHCRLRGDRTRLPPSHAK